MPGPHTSASIGAGLRHGSGAPGNLSQQVTPSYADWRASHGDPVPLALDFYAPPVEAVARALLGQYLVRQIDSETVVARIVETEAYSAGNDQASHSYRGKTPRNASMFGPAGHAYVYRSYGVHFMLNVVTTQRDGPATAVLIRGMEAVTWSDVLMLARPHVPAEAVLRGPGNLCAALRITKDLDGHALGEPPLLLAAGEAPPAPIITSTRIGISKSVELPWRFYVQGSPGVSRLDRSAEAALLGGTS